MSVPRTLPSLTQVRQSLAHGTGAGVRIAILDSGVEASHPRLAGLTLRDDLAIAGDGVHLTTVAGHGEDLYGHGTAIAAIVRAVAPEAELGSIRVLNAQLGSRTAVIAEGVRTALGLGYRILNCSFGCRGQAQHLPAFKAWVDAAYLQGVHVVSACNNLDFTITEWPGHFPTAVTVNMARVPVPVFLRAEGTLVEFAAAGCDVEVAWRGQATRLMTGSSFAAPVVTALLARLLSRHPDLTPLEAKALLLRAAADWSPEVAGPNVGETPHAPPAAGSAPGQA